MKKIGITETILRDAHQSLIATRMTTEEMLPALEMLDKIGFRSLECWGGATFDSCLRFLNEDPWERLRTLKKHMPNTPLQMLFRGQNMLGYRHYADDVVEYFVQKSVANGIDVIRIFDALNDIRNLQTSINAAKKEKGAHVQVAVSYTTSPVHDIPYFVQYAKQLEDAGADSICIKDMAGLLLPQSTYDLVKALKENVSLPIQLHSHFTAGIADMVLLKGIEAGADGAATALLAQPQLIGPADASGRPKPVNASGDPERIPADIIIVAIGQGIESDPFAADGLPVKRGAFVTDKTGFIRGFDGVYAGGDCVTGPATAVRAIAAGKVAAANIDSALGFCHEISVDVEIPAPDLASLPAWGRVNTSETPADIRKNSFCDIECGMSQEGACQEASRCLRCDHFGYGAFKGGRVEKW